MRQFDGPIPGQSLTTAPKSFPWERPPEMTDPEEVVQMYLTRLNQEEVLESILDMLELDVTVVQFTEGLMRIGVAEGLHSIDVGLVIAPIIHEFVVSIAEDAEIEFDEGLEDKKAKAEKEKIVMKAKKEKRIEKLLQEKGSTKKAEPEDSGLSDEFEDAFEDSADVVSEESMKEAPKGLMARKV